jgi:hypothetical protein
VAEVYGDLAKEVETMYKAQVRPIKEDYKKWKLDYLYNQRQLQERRFKEGVEDVKTQGYEQAMKQAHLSWKQVSERLREDAKVGPPTPPPPAQSTRPCTFVWVTNSVTLPVRRVVGKAVWAGMAPPATVLRMF